MGWRGFGFSFSRLSRVSRVEVSRLSFLGLVLFRGFLDLVAAFGAPRPSRGMWGLWGL